MLLCPQRLTLKFGKTLDNWCFRHDSPLPLSPSHFRPVLSRDVFG